MNEQSVAKERNHKIRGCYVVTEAGCMAPESGAFMHISVGVRELGQHFNLEVLTPPARDFGYKTSPQVRCAKKTSTRKHENRLYGSLKDLGMLLSTSVYSSKLAIKLTRAKPDFVYVREAYLDPLPFFLYFLGIPFFVEVNGLLFESRKQYFRSFLTPLVRAFERLVYKLADHVFFIGSYGHYWSLKSSNWSNTENGIDQQKFDQFPIPKVASEGTLRICFLGHLMSHHSPEVFARALNQLPEGIELHLIGSNLDRFRAEIKEDLKVVLHGFLRDPDLVNVLRKMDIGIIPGVTEYQSQMKLFDYGAARLAVLAPNVTHMRELFSGYIALFEPGDSESLTEQLLALANDRKKIAELGNMLHAKIHEEFLWSQIFAKKAWVIKSSLA